MGFPIAQLKKYIDPLTTNGDILVRIGGVTSRLPISANGKILKLVTGLPSWEDESGGGGGGDPIGTIDSPDSDSAILLNPILHDSTGLHRLVNISPKFGYTEIHHVGGMTLNAIGRWGSALTNGGSIDTTGPTADNRYGNIQLNTGTNNADGSRIFRLNTRRGNNAGILATEWTVDIPDAGTLDVDDFQWQCGLNTSTALTFFPEVALFRWRPNVNNNIQTLTANDSSLTQSATSEVLEAGVHSFRVVIDKTGTPEVRYYIDNVLVDTITTNVPTTGELASIAGVTKNTGSSEFAVHIEQLREDTIFGTTPRW